MNDFPLLDPRVPQDADKHLAEGWIQIEGGTSMLGMGRARSKGRHRPSVVESMPSQVYAADIDSSLGDTCERSSEKESQKKNSKTGRAPASQLSKKPSKKQTSGSKKSVLIDSVGVRTNSDGCNVIEEINPAQNKKRKVCNKECQKDRPLEAESLDGVTSFFGDHIQAQSNAEGCIAVNDNLLPVRLEGDDIEGTGKGNINEEATFQKLLHHSRVKRKPSKGPATYQVADQSGTHLNPDDNTVVNDVNSVEPCEEHSFQKLCSSIKPKGRPGRRRMRKASLQELLRSGSSGEDCLMNETSPHSIDLHGTQLSSKECTLLQVVNSEHQVEGHAIENRDNLRRNQKETKRNCEIGPSLVDSNTGIEPLVGVMTSASSDMIGKEANSEGCSMIQPIKSAEHFVEHVTDVDENSRSKETTESFPYQLGVLVNPEEHFADRFEVQVNLEEPNVQYPEEFGLQNTGRSSSRGRRETVGKKPVNLEELDREKKGSSARPKGGRKEANGKKTMFLQDSDPLHEISSRNRVRRRPAKFGNQIYTTSILSSKKQITSVDKVTLMINEMNTPDIGSFSHSPLGQASKLQNSDLGPCAGSPRVSGHCSPANSAQELSVSNCNGKDGHPSSVCCSLSHVRLPQIRGSVELLTGDNLSERVFVQEHVVSGGDHHWNEDQQQVLSHKNSQSPVQCCTGSNGVVADIAVNGDMMHAEKPGSAAVSFLNKDDVSCPLFSSLTSSVEPWTASYPLDGNTDFVAHTEGNGLASLLSLPKSAADTLQGWSEKKQMDFVSIPKNNQGLNCAQSLVSSGQNMEMAEGLLRGTNILELDRLLNVSRECFQCVGISHSTDSRCVMTEVSALGPPHKVSKCGETRNDVSCAFHLPTSTLPGPFRTENSHDVDFEQVEFGPMSIGALPFAHHETILSAKEFDKRKPKQHGVRKVKPAPNTSEKNQQEMQSDGVSPASRRRKVNKPGIESLKVAQHKKRASKQVLVRKQSMSADQKNLARRRREIVKRTKAWASQAGFLQVSNKGDAHMALEENRLIINEFDRERFVESMVEMCHNNPRLRSSFLGSVKAISQLGLLQISATEILSQIPSKEAEDVIQSWEQVTNGSSDAYASFLKSVDNLHKASQEVSPFLSPLESPWSYHLDQTGEGILDVLLPKC